MKFFQFFLTDFLAKISVRLPNAFPPGAAPLFFCLVQHPSFFRTRIVRKTEVHPVETSNARLVTATASLYMPSSIIPDAAASEQASNPSSPVCDSNAPAHQDSRQDMPFPLNTTADNRLLLANTVPVMAAKDNQWSAIYRRSIISPADTKQSATKNTLNGATR